MNGGFLGRPDLEVISRKLLMVNKRLQPGGWEPEKKDIAGDEVQRLAYKFGKVLRNWNWSAPRTEEEAGELFRLATYAMAEAFYKLFGRHLTNDDRALCYAAWCQFFFT